MTREAEILDAAKKRMLDPGSLTDGGQMETRPRSFFEKAGSAIESAANTAAYYGSDLAQSALGGPRRGLESIPATGGDVYDLLNTVYSAGAGATAPEQDKIYQEMDAQRGIIPGGGPDLLPTSAEVGAATDPWLGEHYQPKTMAGQFLNDLGATVTGGGGRHFVRNWIGPLFREDVVPTLAGEIGSAAGEVVGGRAGAALGGVGAGALAGTAPEFTMRRVAQEAPAERQRLLQTLQQEQIPFTGGQATGSDRLQQIEVGPYANRPAALADQQSRAYTSAAMRRAGLNSNIADDVTMRTAQDDFGQQYETLIRANNGLVMDPAMEQALIDIGTRYERLKGGNVQNDAVATYFNRILDTAQQHGGVIPPDVFQQLHGEIAADIRAGRNSPELGLQSQTLRDMQDAMFDTIGRNGQPQIQTQLQDLNRRYRNFKIIEKALVGGGQDTAYGHVTPAKLGQAVRGSEDSMTYTQSRGEFDDLVKAGTLLKPLPNSTSAGRILPYAVGSGLVSGLGAAGGQLLSGDPLTAAMTAAGTAGAATLPFVPGALAASRPVQTSIINRAMGNGGDYMSPMNLVPLLGESMPAPVDVEPLAPDDQSMNFDMPVPVDDTASLIDPRARDILRLRGLG